MTVLDSESEQAAAIPSNIAQHGGIFGDQLADALLIAESYCAAYRNLGAVKEELLGDRPKILRGIVVRAGDERGAVERRESFEVALVGVGFAGEEPGGDLFVHRFGGSVERSGALAVASADER